MRKLLKKISDLKNAYRVLEIMDKVGCDIEQVSTMNGYYKLKPKWYVSERDAKDLQKIVLHKENYYGNHHMFWKIWFKNIRDGYRYL